MSHADVVSKCETGSFWDALVWREGMESWAKLESVPAFQILGKPEVPVKVARAKNAEPVPAEDGNPVVVYERPVATLVFDEAVEDDWKAPPKAREPSRSVREPSRNVPAASARPPAPSLPPLAPRRSPVVPSDEPPPPPPLPPRKPPLRPVRRSTR
jgi:hypothetical protein